jgi:membrane fusion protein, copper/silver efflux system
LTVDNGQLTTSTRSNSVKEFLTTAICQLPIILLLILVSCTNNKEQTQHTETYTCPMHPTVISDKQGTCPVCGMDLVRKVRPGEEVKMTEDLARLIKSPNEVVVASIKTVKVNSNPCPFP